MTQNLADAPSKNFISSMIHVRPYLQNMIESVFRSLILLAFYLQLNRGVFESKHNYLLLLSLFKLTTCFGLSTGPSEDGLVLRPKHVVSLNKDNNKR